MNSTPPWRRGWGSSSRSSDCGMPGSCTANPATVVGAGRSAQPVDAAGAVRTDAYGRAALRARERGHSDRRGRPRGRWRRSPGRFTGSRSLTAFATSCRPPVQLDVRGRAETRDCLRSYLLFCLWILFDNVGTLLAVGKKAGLFTGRRTFRGSAAFSTAMPSPPLRDRWRGLRRWSAMWKVRPAWRRAEVRASPPL